MGRAVWGANNVSESVTLECGPEPGQVWVVSTRSQEQWPDAWRDGVSVWSPSQDFDAVPVPLGLGRTLVEVAEGRELVVARWNGDNEVSLELDGCWSPVTTTAPLPPTSTTAPPVVVSAPPPVPQTVPEGDALTSIIMVDTAPPVPVLPVTGSSVAPLVIVAVLVILAGVAAVLAGRR